MNKKSVPFTVLVLALAILFPVSGIAVADTVYRPAAQGGSLPQIEFLGEGPGTFTLDPPLIFLVKTYEEDEFRFILVDPPTYEAVRRERVWSIDRDPGNIRLFHESRSYGTVENGCEVRYVQIEDNVDSRRNSFYLNGDLVHTVEQGWVTYGSFVAPETGELTFYAEDSVGLIVLPCQVIVTGTPPSPPPSTPLATETSTPTSTATSTSTPPATPTATNTVPTTSPIQRTATPTNTLTPVTNTRTPGAISTTVSQATAITATLVATPAAIPVTGGGPGAGEIARAGAALVAAFGLTGIGWRQLIQWWRRNE